MTVTFIWPDRRDPMNPRSASLSVPWAPNKTIQRYLHDPVLRRHRLLSIWLRSYTVDSKARPIRLTSVPSAGEVISFLKPVQ